MILVTGSEGLIGRHLCARLADAGIAFRRFDLRNGSHEDTRDRNSLAQALEGITGVVHLAAISRVVWGERDPELCRITNIDALRSLIELAAASKPWIVFGSSREVYGDQELLPVSEDAERIPVNVYGRSKLAGEWLMQEARYAGFTANICRFSNVFGCVHDHPDRVAMAFANVAAHGGVMSLEGPENTFDFTTVEDVVEGLLLVIQASMTGENLPLVHFVSGKGTTLRELAGMAQAHALADVEVVEVPPRNFDVSRFIGDPARAEALLGWKAKTDIGGRLSKLIRDMAIMDNAKAA